jgi:hypothetical protein
VKEARRGVKEEAVLVVVRCERGEVRSRGGGAHDRGGEEPRRRPCVPARRGGGRAVRRIHKNQWRTSRYSWAFT